MDFCPTLVLLEYDGGDSMQVSRVFMGMELYKHLNVSFAAFKKKCITVVAIASNSPTSFIASY